jgi:outer membrane protein assembly factor BamD
MKGTEKGQEALYLFGLCNYYSENYETATAIFRKYYQTYPKGVYTEAAHFYSGLALMNEAPEPRLDQTPTYEAVTEFQNFIELYPYSERRDQAMQHIFTLQDLLVEKEYLSAKLYYDLGDYFGNCSNDGGSNYQACVITAENAIRDFPYTKLREDFAILILKAKFELAAKSIEEKKEERYHNAIDEYYGFLNEYPESKYLKEAEQLFNKAEKYTTIK